MLSRAILTAQAQSIEWATMVPKQPSIIPRYPYTYLFGPRPHVENAPIDEEARYDTCKGRTAFARNTAASATALS